MKWWESSLHILGISFCHYAYIKAYSNIFKIKTRSYNIKDLVLLLLITLFTFCNTFYNHSFTKIIISFIELFLLYRIIFNENSRYIFFKTIIFYLLAWILETILGGLIFYIFFNSVKQFNNNIVMKVLFSVLMMLFYLLISNIKIIKKTIINIFNYINKMISLLFIIIFFIIVLSILTFYLILSNDIVSYISIIILIIIFLFLFIMLIIQSINTKKEEEKQQILFEFMKEYEIIIDKERIDRHEMVNNLLILKSIEEKSSKEYNKILDELLDTYKSVNTCKKLYDLPSGLKGIFYYKIYEMRSKKIEVFINISDSAIEKLDKINTKSIAKLCKIIGIIMDNAREAAELSKEKKVLIDVYNENENVIIYIENSFVNKNLDIFKINIKGYSTKGSKRGYGLYLVQNIIKQCNIFDFKQKISNNNFVTIVKIKNS